MRWLLPPVFLLCLAGRFGLVWSWIAPSFEPWECWNACLEFIYDDQADFKSFRWTDILNFIKADRKTTSLAETTHP
ncbi:hypothetical protein B0H17DRAFT_1030844 [Mycena rosella]|uniref:Uncharacterized protein n=1 Tax=Mycena rosella TaxID=1033263 RepID=A0AAD7GZI1_MYCRO|nr:hypothetical protein B0H17DRAFT_1030844 [Mycena rosella]